jgi:hypothetical protein
MTSINVAMSLTSFYQLNHWPKACVSSWFTGVFTVSGIIDSFVYHGQRAITKKRELGKFNWAFNQILPTSASYSIFRNFFWTTVDALESESSPSCKSISEPTSRYLCHNFCSGALYVPRANFKMAHLVYCYVISHSSKWNISEALHFLYTNSKDKCFLYLCKSLWEGCRLCVGYLWQVYFP